MKNKFTILLSVLLVMLLLPFINVKAASTDSYIDWNLDRTVFAHQYRNGSDHITNLAMITANGIVAYCIEPGVVADKGSYYSSTTNIGDTKLNGVNTKKLSLIGYYGYGYKGHEAKEYYMAAQELIWREMGVENVWWTDSKEGGNILNINSYKDKIINLINRYEVNPLFDFKDKYIVGDEVTLEDKNNVLNGYEVSGNNYVTINENKIQIKVKEGDNSFVLKRKQNGKFTKFYYKDGYQTIGSFEFPYDYEKNYDINYTYGKIIVNKLDADTKSKVPLSKYASLEKATYGLYDFNDNLIMSSKTDKDGNAVFDKLPKGNYIVKELIPSKGYTVSKTIIKTFLSTNQLTITTTSYEDIIKNKIVITKVLDDEDNKICIPEEGILFHVYDSFDNLVAEAITDENGKITLDLPYGRYILKQISTLEGIDKVKDRVIEVTEDGINQDIVLVNHKLKEDTPIKTLPNTGNNNILYIILLMSLSIIGVIYEKKQI